MKKRWRSVFLAAALALTLLAVPAQALRSYAFEGLSVVDEGYWYQEEGFYTAICPTTILYSYGLVNGMGTRDDGLGSIITGVERPITRQEAVTLLVRLLGLEEEAISGQWNTPFTDVAAWAAPYVGCAYARGMAAGTSGTTFSGENPITMEQFLTLMLRALGYSDAQGDFSWQDPYALADQVGLLCPLFSGEGFLRGDAMFICYEALDACPKGSDTTLLEQLEQQGAMEQRGIPMLSSTCLKADPDTLPQQLDYLREEFGVTDVTIDFSGYPSLTAFTDQLWDYCQQRGYWAPWPADISYLPTRSQEVKTDPAWLQAYWDAQAEIGQVNQTFLDQGLDYHVANQAWYQAQADYLADKLPRESWSQQVRLLPAAKAIMNDYQLDIRLYEEKGILNTLPSAPHGLGSSILTENDQDSAYVLQDAERLWDLYHQLVDEDMTDYQKVKAIYDGVIARTDYHYDAYRRFDNAPAPANADYLLAYTWLGVAEGSKVVCSGYAQAMSLLLDLAGIPNVMLTGTSADGGHAWNKVLLDGQWYNLDATWGDTTSDPYKYFLRSDQAFSQDGHQDFETVEFRDYNIIFPAPADYR